MLFSPIVSFTRFGVDDISTGDLDLEAMSTKWEPKVMATRLACELDLVRMCNKRSHVGACDGQVTM